MKRKPEVCLFLIILFSAFRLSYHEHKKVAFIVPQNSFYVGELFTLFPKKNNDYYLANKKLETLNYQKFAVAPLVKKEKLYFYKRNTKPSNLYEKLFGRKFLVEKQQLKVRRPPLKEDNYLRLPSSVWKKVNKKDKLREDSLKVRSVYHQDYKKREPGCFSYPIRSVRVSKFAAARSLPNGHSYYHTGLDLRSLWPEPILSMGDGEVVLAEHMTAPGNIVIVYHGRGIFSRYMHLSKIGVKVGEEIKKGESLGLSGRSGRVEAPHLHWEIIWKGNHANPEHFLPQWNRYCSLT